ncbi:HNH endonuclease [Kineococcus arenarius]|uniref:HNH endonuclease n=1 Tax=unclassified Kineococcus TaxID=2621656 RepID=UPI003D7D8FB4
MSAQARTSTRRWRALRARILAASDVCHLCGLPGADEVDHVVPVALGGAEWDPVNLAPAHGGCNRRKGARLHMPAARTPMRTRDREVCADGVVRMVPRSREW